MNAAPWNGLPDIDDDPAVFDRPRPTLVSLHFIRTALRRRLWVCVLCAVLGLGAAWSFMLAFPPAHAAKASLVLTYDPQVEPTQAMATNVSLLETRTFATRTVANLGLPVAPEDFLKSLTIEPEGSELLLLTLTAPDDAEAVRRLNAVTSIYLEFRAEQLSLQSNVVVDGLQERITKLQADVEALSVQIEQLSRAGSASTSKLSDAISQRGSILGRIEALQQQVEDATLRNSAVVASSRVLDPPAAEPGRAKRSVVLGLASGLIAGTALGCGTVLFFAITSDRLRRRADVASALRVNVPISVARIAPLPKVWLWLPPVKAINRRRTDERQRLAHAIEDELLRPQQGSRLAVAGLDNADELGFAVAEAARSLAARGSVITVIDLTNRGSKDLRAAPGTAGSSTMPSVLRPRGLPALAHGVTDLVPVGYWDDGKTTPPSAQLNDVVLILADLDPAVGADHLTAWTDRVMVAVTAGRSSVEKARTVGDQVRAAGLDLRFAALLGTERSDDSSGMISAGRPAPVQRRAEQEDPELAGRFEAR
jgi:hypothetical protein